MLKPSLKVRVLAAALAVALCAATALAADLGESTQAGGDAGQEQNQTAQTGGPERDQTGDETGSPPAEDQTGEQSEEEQPEEIVPDAVGTVSFANLDSRLRENNLNVLALEENIAALEVIDYDKMGDAMRESLNDLANGMWETQFGGTSGTSFDLSGIVDGITDNDLKKQLEDLEAQLNLTIGGISGAMSSSVLQTMDQSYKALREQFEDLKDGKLQEDNEAVIRQLRNAQDQVVMAAQSMYVALVEMELNDASLDRTLAALDRTVEEMELRYDLGQISALTLEQTKAGKSTAVSGKETLEMNIANYKYQLELMLGAQLSGTIQLQPLPQVTGQDLEAMDLEADLEQAKANSYQLFAAQRTLEDAKESAKESAKDYTEKTYQYQMAQHQRQAAEYTYNATVQSFEMSFRTLYNQVKDDWQVLSAAQTALACQQDTYASMELKYEQGNLSENKLKDAADEVSAAQDTVDSAKITLFSAYNNYRWAVDYGILN